MAYLIRTTVLALALCTAPMAAFPVLAQSLDGNFTGASSTAGGTGDCWGNSPASAIVSGGTVTIRYVAYEGTQSPLSASLKPDGSFAMVQEIKGGTISYTGKVTAKRITANWKGPACYGTLDLSR